MTQRCLAVPQALVQAGGVEMRVGQFWIDRQAALVVHERLGVAASVFERDRRG